MKNKKWLVVCFVLLVLVLAGACGAVEEDTGQQENENELPVNEEVTEATDQNQETASLKGLSFSYVPENTTITGTEEDTVTLAFGEGDTPEAVLLLRTQEAYSSITEGLSAEESMTFVIWSYQSPYSNVVELESGECQLGGHPAYYSYYTGVYDNSISYYMMTISCDVENVNYSLLFAEPVESPEQSAYADSFLEIVDTVVISE